MSNEETLWALALFPNAMTIDDQPVNTRTRTMAGRPCRKFTRTHLRIFLGLYLLFAVLTVLILIRQSEGDQRSNWNVAATVGVVTGPFAGAIARNLQACCLSFSVNLLPYAAAVPIAGVLLQFVPLPSQRFQVTFRIAVWCLGWLGWFASAILSFAHALS